MEIDIISGKLFYQKWGEISRHKIKNAVLTGGMCMLNGFAWHFCAVFQQCQTWLFKENARLLMPSVAGSSCSSPGQTETHLFCQVFCDATRQARQHSDFSLHFFSGDRSFNLFLKYSTYFFYFSWRIYTWIYTCNYLDCVAMLLLL